MFEISKYKKSKLPIVSIQISKWGNRGSRLSDAAETLKSGNATIQIKYNRNTMTTFSLSMVVNWDNVIGHCSEIFS